MSDIDVILDATEFIEAHLTEEITVADMAEAVSFSLYHFSRTFSRVTRHTPYDYLMRRRLTEAARCLLESDKKIIDIAFNYQFNAPETFSRAFRRVFNLQPRQVKLKQVIDQRRFLPRMTMGYLEFLNRGVALKPTAKKLPALQIAGVASQIDTFDTGSTISNTWNLVAQEIQSRSLETEERDCYGILMVLPSYPANRIMYLAGVTLNDGELPPATFVQKNIPATGCVYFDLPKQANAAYLARNYVYHSWWPKATNASLPTFEIEYFPDLPDCKSVPNNVNCPQLLYLPFNQESGSN